MFFRTNTIIAKSLRVFGENETLFQASNLLATDESGFPLNLAPQRGYVLKGQEIVNHRPTWGTNYNLLLIIQNTSRGGIISWNLVIRNSNNFLSNTELSKNKKHYLLLDNIRLLSC